MKTGRNNNNRGYSLVELIVVIAIMAILVGVFSISVGSLSGRKINKCADEIVATLERTRVLTLGKEQNQVEFRLYYDATQKEYKAQIYQGGTLVSDRTVGNDAITIKVTFEGDATEYDLKAGTIQGSEPYVNIGSKTDAEKIGLFLVFNRSSGAFEQNTNSVGGTDKTYCKKVTVSGGNREIEITPVGRTGKILKQSK